MITLVEPEQSFCKVQHLSIIVSKLGIEGNILNEGKAMYTQTLQYISH